MAQFGLVMIMKNEEKIIEKCLESVYKYINYWTICDTGSSDRSCEIVEKFFKDKNIPGQLLHHEWKGFSHNRTLAFQAAEDKSAWLFVIDSDDYLLTPLTIPPECTGADSLVILLEEGINVTQKRQQIFRSGLQWGYAGIVHEYPYSKTKKDLVVRETSKIKVRASRGGDRSKDPLKYWKDAQLMEQDLKRIEAIPKNRLKHWEEDLAGRYHYYISQSYFDFHHYEECIKWCESRTTFRGFKEEIYRAMLNKGRCLRELGADSKTVIKAFQECHDNDMFRAEAAFEIMNEYQKMGDLNKAWDLLQKVMSMKKPKDKMFIVEDYVYNWGKLQKASIISHTLRKYDTAYKYADMLFQASTETYQKQYANQLKEQNIPFILESYKTADIPSITPFENKKIVFNLTITDEQSAIDCMTTFFATCQDYRDVDWWCFTGLENPIEFLKRFPFFQHGKEYGKNATLMVPDNKLFFHKFNLIEFILDMHNPKIPEKDILEQREKELQRMRKMGANNDVLGPKVGEIVSLKRQIAAVVQIIPKILYLNCQNNNDYPLMQVSKPLNCAYVVYPTGQGIYCINFNTTTRAIQ